MQCGDATEGDDMDGRQFDQMTRTLAGGVSRRRVAGGLLGAAAAGLLAGVRGRRATAQEALPLGATCTAATQCSQVGGAVACADNGYAADGALNCCRNAGGACLDAAYSADCCSGLYCRGGFCTDLSATGELPLGSYCTASSQCSQVGGEAICADNTLADDGALNCCRNAGGACARGADCCGGLECLGGVCGAAPAAGTPTATTPTPVAPAPTSGLALGATCVATAECAPTAAGAVFCAANGLTSDGAFNCCLGTGGACGTNDALCCGSNFCVGGVCQAS